MYAKPNNYYTEPLRVCQQLHMYDQWVLWKIEARNGKLAKIPYQTNGNRAKTNDPQTWTTFKTALTTLQTNDTYAGLGFVFTPDDDLVFIDLDNCFDGNGSLNGHTSLVEEFIEVGAFVERSISGQGLHIISRAKLNKAHVDHAKHLEIYPHGRFVALTGDVYAFDGDIGNCQTIINRICNVIEPIVEPVKRAILTNIPIPMLQRKLPFHFWTNMNWLKTAPKGTGFAGYRSRSEVEFSCLLTIIKYGYSYDSACAMFEGMKPGHYIELGPNRYTYLKNSWAKAINLFTNTQIRIQIVDMFNNVPRLKLTTDMNVLRGLLISAYMADSFIVGVDQRTLGLLAGVMGRRTVRKAIKRLIEYELVDKAPEIDGVRSNCYVINRKEVSCMTIKNIFPTWVTLPVLSRLFREIGGSSLQVYEILNNEGQTVKEIATKLDKHVETIRDALKRLEYYSMAIGIKRKWIIGSVNLEDVVRVLQIEEQVEDHKIRIKRAQFIEEEKRRVYKEWIVSQEEKALQTCSKESIIDEKENDNES